MMVLSSEGAVTVDHRVRGHPGLPRVRLLDQLDTAVADGPALVLAPAGYGKSTLLAQYAHWHPGPVASYQADALETRPGETTARLLDAIRSAADEDDASEVAEDAADEPAAVLEAMTVAARQPGGLLVTLDDVDELIGTPGEEVLTRVLARRPRAVKIVLAARRPLGLRLLRQEMSGDAVVGVDDLRFRHWEVERLLEELYREPLPAADAAALARNTGGWPAGLALFHRATRGRPMADRGRAASAALERWPAFRQFFDEAVLAGVPDDVVALLVQTSVLDAITADRCARLIGRPVADAVLQSLVREYALPMTVLGDSYRYEPAFRAHLALRLAERAGAGGLRDWHQRAAGILLEEEAYPEAARALARAGDWTGLQLLFAEYGTAVIRPPVADLAELVPAAQRVEEPWLVFAEADDHMNNAQLVAARDGFTRAAAMFTARDASGDDAGLHATGSKLSEVESLLSATPTGGGRHWTAWLRAAVGPHAMRNARTATELTPAGAELIRLVAAVYGGGVPEEITRETHRVGIDPRDSPVALLGLRLVRTCIAAGRGLASPAALERIADEAEGQGLGWIARLALGARALGGAPYTAADTYAVAAACHRAGDHWGHLLLSSVAAICEMRDGRLDEGRLDSLRAEATTMGAESIAVWAEAFGVLARARRQAPGLADEAQTAMDRAERADVPGAVIVGMLALSVVDPVRRASLLRAATARAADGEVPRAALRFWLSTYAAATVADSAPPAVRIRCFGGFGIEVNGHPLDLSRVRPRARSALRLLAMQAGRYVHREVLIEALWSDLPPAAATRNLQVTISALRGLLEPQSGRGKAQMLVRSGDAYGIVLPSGGYADTAAFSDAVQRWQQQRRAGSFAAEVEALTAALAAYGGDLLPEEGPVEWAVEWRDYYRGLATRMARELAVAELSRGHVAEAIRAAEQCIALDPHDDEAWQVLLRGYDRSGTPARAAEGRQRYAEMLAKLGVSPSR